MFDQQQQKLLEHALLKIHNQFKKNNSVYEVSDFDSHFDQELEKLVLHYSFDFDAIALHLYFKYPQYAHRLKPQAVSYRWYQLTMEKEAESIKSQHQQLEDKYRKQKGKEQNCMNSQTLKEEIKEEQDVTFYNLEDKLLQYETAMMKAMELDDQQNQSFMLYKPKFIIDTQFKLERESSNDAKHLSALVDNEVCFQFGQFEPPQAAPLPEIASQKPLAVTSCLSAAPSTQQEQQQTHYLDQDWQQYQSD